MGKLLGQRRDHRGNHLERFRYLFNRACLGVAGESLNLFSGKGLLPNIIFKLEEWYSILFKTKIMRDQRK